MTDERDRDPGAADQRDPGGRRSNVDERVPTRVTKGTTADQVPVPTVGPETKVSLRDEAWKRQGTDAPDAADIEDPASQL